MPEQLPFTAFLNHLFAAPLTRLLEAMHIHPAYPQAPITNPVAMQILVVLLLGLWFAAIRMRLSVDRPGGLQHIAEGINGFFSNLGEELIGHEFRKFVPYISALGIYILSCNL